jgi:hypothetical protein
VRYLAPVHFAQQFYDDAKVLLSQTLRMQEWEDIDTLTMMN